MKRSELLKILKKNGCKLIGHGGNHDLYYSPITGKQLPSGGTIRTYRQELLKLFLNRLVFSKAKGEIPLA